MKRPELLLGAILLSIAIFIGVEARRAPRRGPSAVAMDAVAAPAEPGEGLLMSSVRRSALPAPPPHDYADIRERLAEARGVTYMEDILAERGGNIARWVDRRDAPITVWIQPRPAIRDFWPEFRDQVRDAFYTWSGAGVPIRFLFIDDSAAAEVHVRWVDRFTDAAAGKTYWARDQNWWIVGADIELSLHRPSGQAYDGQMVRTIAIHEVGHLIGLDHSVNIEDIMSPRVHVTNLSPADLRTAALIYQLPPGPVAPPGAK